MRSKCGSDSKLCPFDEVWHAIKLLLWIGLSRVIVVWINPVFATRWQFGHERLVLLFDANVMQKYFSIESYHIFKKNSVAQLCWAENTWCVVALHRRARRPCLREDVCKHVCQLSSQYDAFNDFINENVISKTCWLNYISIVSIATVPG